MPLSRAAPPVPPRAHERSISQQLSSVFTTITGGPIESNSHRTSRSGSTFDYSLSNSDALVVRRRKAQESLNELLALKAQLRACDLAPILSYVPLVTTVRCFMMGHGTGVIDQSAVFVAETQPNTVSKEVSAEDQDDDSGKKTSFLQILSFMIIIIIYI
jgi:hypothetical protein